MAKQILFFVGVVGLLSCSPPGGSDPAPDASNSDVSPAAIDAGLPDPSCTNNAQDGDESDVDCGGECTPCGPDDHCVDAADCVSGVCQDQRCAEALCDDGVRNQDEADVDCGGLCGSTCADSARCSSGLDCQSLVCDEGLCRPASCDDGVHNGQETDLDCGGDCAQACSPGLRCQAGSDCISGSCQDQQCQEPNCDDGIHNGDERALDCGGSCESACPAGTPCERNDDCVSNVCAQGQCEADPIEACLNGPHADDDEHRVEACLMLRYINQDRALFADESGNAVPARWDPDMYLVAKAHSQDMCDRGFFAHVNPDGRNPSQRAELMGFNVPVAENIAVNRHASSASHAFMAEPTCTGHRGAILDPRNTRVGIGLVQCDNPGFRWDSYMMYTQNFHLNFRIEQSAFCLDPQTACELPSNPVTTATQDCPDQLRQWGWCDYDPSAIMTGWGCPDD